MHVVDNLADFSKYFIGTYIAIQDNEKLVPRYVRNVIDAGHVDLRPTSETREPIFVTFEEIITKYKIIPPRAGTITTSQGIVYTSVIPERQYRKGLCEARLNITNFTQIRDDGRLAAFVNEMYNNRYFKIDVLLNEIRDGTRLGGALSPKVGVHIKPTIQTPILTYKSQVCGIVVSTKDEREIQLLPKFVMYREYIKTIIPNYDVKVWKP